MPLALGLTPWVQFGRFPRGAGCPLLYPDAVNYCPSAVMLLRPPEVVPLMLRARETAESAVAPLRLLVAAAAVSITCRPETIDDARVMPRLRGVLRLQYRSGRARVWRQYDPLLQLLSSSFATPLECRAKSRGLRRHQG